MASTPDLNIKISVEEQEFINEFLQATRKVENILKSSAAKQSAIIDKGEAQKVAAIKKGEGQAEAEYIKGQAKIEVENQKHQARLLRQQEAREAKALASQKSWSSKMTSQLTSLTASVRAFAVAYAAVFVGSALKGALDYVGSLSDISDAMNVAIEDAYVLRRASIDAGQPFEKVVKLFGQLNTIRTDPNAEQKGIFATYGIKPEEITTLELFNKVLSDSSLAEKLLSGNAVLALNAIRAQEGATYDLVKANILAKNNLSSKDLEKISRAADEIGTAMDDLKDKLTLSLARSITTLKPQILSFIETIIKGVESINFENVGLGILYFIKFVGYLGVTTKYVIELSLRITGLIGSLAVLGTSIEVVYGSVSRLYNGLFLLWDSFKLNTSLKDVWQILSVSIKSTVNNLFKWVETTSKLTKPTQVLSDTFKYISSLFGKLGTAIVALKTEAGLLLRGLGFFTKKLPIIGTIITIVQSLYRFYDALTHGDNILQAFKYTFLSFINDLTFGLTPLDDYIQKLRDAHKEVKTLDEAFTELKNAGWFDEPTGESPVPKAARNFGESAEEYKKRLASYKGFRDAFSQGLIDEIEKRRKRLDEINKELAKYPALFKAYAKDAVATASLKESYKELADEKNKLLGITEKSTEAEEQYNKTIRTQNELLQIAINRARARQKAEEEATKSNVVEGKKPITAVNDELAAAIKKRNDIYNNAKYNLAGLEGVLARNSIFVDGVEHTLTNKEKDFVKDKIKYFKEEARNAAQGGTGDVVKSEGFIDKFFFGAYQTESEQKWQALLHQFGDIGIKAMNQYFENVTVGIDNQITKTEKLIELERQRWEEQSSNLREAGLETSVYYRNLERTTKATEKRRQEDLRKLQEKGFNLQKKANIASAIMDTSGAVMSALDSVKPTIPFGLIAAALVGAIGASKIASIRSQENPYSRAFGGIIPGNRPNSDSVPVLATGGEFIVNRRATQDNLGLLEAINSGKNINGAPTINISINGGVLTKDFVNTELVPAIKKGMKDVYGV